MSVFEHVKEQLPLWELPCPYCSQVFESVSLLNKNLVVARKVTRAHHPFNAATANSSSMNGEA